MRACFFFAALNMHILLAFLLLSSLPGGTHATETVSVFLFLIVPTLLCPTGIAPELPEDLYHLIKKAVNIRKHLERNRADTDSKFRLILIESRVHRLSRYYKTQKVLAPTWKYESATASALVS